MVEKFRTLVWFSCRPPFWRHMFELIRRKLVGLEKAERYREEATAWAAQRINDIDLVFQRLGLADATEGKELGLPRELLADAEKRKNQIDAIMGGPGDIDLIHRAILAIGAKRVLETGVAAGWSSMAALCALERTGGHLVSVDMPYPKSGTEHLVGIVVPHSLRERWTLLRLPDRTGIGKAIGLLGGSIDLVHYDSDKSYAGRTWAYPILWDALQPGGLFISDDVQDNFGFRDFVATLGIPFFVIESQGKYVGLIRKPRGSKAEIASSDTPA